MDEEISSARHESQGWHARLELQFRHSHTRTVLTRRKHDGPLLVQRPFYPERRATAQALEAVEPCHVYIIHPPGGVASGDELQLDVEVQAGSHALLTTPAAGKFYRRGSAGTARVTQTLRVDAGALEWLPQENIFYPDAAVDLRSIVQLSAGARFIGWEIACLGLPASGLTLGAGELRLGFELWREGRPLLLERLAIAAAGLSSRWGLADYAAFGSALIYPAGPQELDLARAAAPEDCAELTLACTLVDGVLACRAIARRPDQLKQVFVRLWQALRPALFGRQAVPPRVWAT